MQRLTGQKLDFLRKYLPGANELPLHRAEPLLHCFHKKILPRGHVLLAQNGATKKCLYLVSSGSVFLSCSDIDMPIMPSKVRTLGSLFRGGVFGSFEERPLQPCAVTCTSTSCELYVASGRNLEALPWVIRRSTQKYLSKTAEWRLEDERCLPSQAEVMRPRSSSCVSVSSKMDQVQPRPVTRRASEPWVRSSGRKAWDLDTTIPQVHSCKDASLSPASLSRRCPGASSLPLLSVS